MGSSNIVLKAGSRPPWIGLAAAVWVELSAGNAYNFPLYSPALKSVLGFNQQQITMLGVANDIGENVGLLPGIACNKFPPWAVLAVGVVACFLGYGVMWLAVSQTVPALPYWLLWIALCIGTNSNAWFGTAVLVTNMRNFPYSRGTVAGILKGYVGLSAAIYTVIYSMVLNESSSDLLLFLAIGIPILCLAMLYFIRPCTPASGEEDTKERGHFMFTQAASVFLAIFVVVITVVNDVVSLSDAISYTFVAVMFILMLSPLAIPIKMTIFPAKPKNSVPSVDSSNQLATEEGDSNPREPLLTGSDRGSFYDDEESDIETLLAVGEGAVKKKRRPRRGEDFKLGEAFIKADFWLLWFAYFLGVGSGVTVLNNLAQIGSSLGIDNTTILLCLFSFCNFVGRLGAGVVSEHFVKTSIIVPRTVWMVCAQIIMIGAFLVYASNLNGTLYVATTLVGICYGVQYSVMVPTVSELFGLKHFGVIYNFMLLGNPAGALILSGVLAGDVYDAEAAKQGSSTCLGTSCFRLTFQILAGVCGFATLLTIILTIRIRPVYQMLYAGGSFRLPSSSGH